MRIASRAALTTMLLILYQTGCFYPPPYPGLGDDDTPTPQELGLSACHPSDPVPWDGNTNLFFQCSVLGPADSVSWWTDAVLQDESPVGAVTWWTLTPEIGANFGNSITVNVFACGASCNGCSNVSSGCKEVVNTTWSVVR